MRSEDPDVGLAEDIAQEALVAALEQWRARAELERAAALTHNARERELLMARVRKWEEDGSSKNQCSFLT